MLGLAWDVGADEGFAALCPVVVLEHCAGVAGGGVGLGGGRVDDGGGARGACGGLVRRVEAGGGRVWHIWI